MPSWVTWFLSTFTYVALILVLIAAGMGVPIPEDIPLVTAGYLSSPEHSPIATVDADTNVDGVSDATRRKVPNVFLMMVAGMIGVLTGDSIVYYIGSRGIEGNNFVTRHLRKVMTPRRLAWTEKHFARHGNLTVFCGRFMPGLRSVVFGVAGMARMGYVRFLLIDGFAALISVPTFVWIGYYFADKFELVLQWIDKVKHIALPVAGAAAVIAIVIYFLRRRARNAAVPAVPEGGELGSLGVPKVTAAKIGTEAAKP